MRQKESEETILNPLAPRSVVNPLAETHPEHNRKLYISPTPGPISKVNNCLEILTALWQCDFTSVYKLLKGGEKFSRNSKA